MVRCAMYFARIMLVVGLLDWGESMHNSPAPTGASNRVPQSKSKSRKSRVRVALISEGDHTSQ